MNWAVVTDVARKALAQSGDPSVSDAERRAVDEAMRLADLWLDPVVDFPAVATRPQATYLVWIDCRETGVASWAMCDKPMEPEPSTTAMAPPATPTCPPWKSTSGNGWQARP